MEHSDPSVSTKHTEKQYKRSVIDLCWSMQTPELAKVFRAKKAKLGPLTPSKSPSNTIVHNKVGCFINPQSPILHLISNMKMLKPHSPVIFKQTKTFPNLGSTTPLWHMNMRVQ